VKNRRFRFAFVFAMDHSSRILAPSGVSTKPGELQGRSLDVSRSSKCERERERDATHSVVADLENGRAKTRSARCLHSTST
jgi:hypothetical protein